MVTYNTTDDLFGVTSYIVDATAGQGNFTTIGAALTAASSAGFSGDIFIRPGTYTETLTLVAGVNLVAFAGDATSGDVIINGNCTLSSAGTVTISGIQLKTNSANCVTVSGSVASVLYLINCNINCLNNTGISYTSSSASSSIKLYNCTGNIGTTGISLFASTSAGTLELDYCIITNTGSSTTASTMAGGSFNSSYSLFGFIISISSSTTGTIYATKFEQSAINATALTTAGTAVINFINCHTNSGSASSLSAGVGSTINAYNCSFFSSNTNAVTGAGTLVTIGCTFTGTSHLNNATTQTGSGSINGLTAGNLPAAGFVGETIHSNATTSIPNSATNITSINITPGNWLLYGILGFGSIGPTSFSFGFGTISGNANLVFKQMATSNTVSNTGVTVWQFSTNSAATIYYVANFGTGTANVTGDIWATRIG